MVNRIPKSSVEKVKVLLKSLYPKAVALSYFNRVARIRTSSAEIICISLGAERIETTGGVYYRWKGKS